MKPDTVPAFIAENRCQYRDGEPALILRTDAPGDEPIISQRPAGTALNHLPDGRYIQGMHESPYDLVPLPAAEGDWALAAAKRIDHAIRNGLLDEDRVRAITTIIRKHAPQPPAEQPPLAARECLPEGAPCQAGWQPEDTDLGWNNKAGCWMSRTEYCRWFHEQRIEARGLPTGWGTCNGTYSGSGLFWRPRVREVTTPAQEPAQDGFRFFADPDGGEMMFKVPADGSIHGFSWMGGAWIAAAVSLTTVKLLLDKGHLIETTSDGTPLPKVPESSPGVRELPDCGFLRDVLAKVPEGVPAPPDALALPACGATVQPNVVRRTR